MPFQLAQWFLRKGPCRHAEPALCLKPGFQWCLVHHCGTSRRSLWHSAFAAGGGTDHHGLKEVAKEEGNQMSIGFRQLPSNPASEGRKQKGYSFCKENNWGQGVWGWLRNDMNIRNLIKCKATSENTFDPVNLAKAISSRADACCSRARGRGGQGFFRH